jgi:SAM-dependent methyltransferase
VTELPDSKASREQLSRLYSRYRFAANFCRDKSVLEVACGAGLGLGYLGSVAKDVVGGDIDAKNLTFARQTYNGRCNVALHYLDAQDLPFRRASFDVVLLYEALYYLSRPDRFVTEARRVLRKGGLLIICTANKDWSGFNPSPYSFQYFSAPELFSLIREGGFDKVSLYADCPVTANGTRDRIAALVKPAAVAFNLMPKTMRGKELLKRVFMGKLSPLPPEITDGVAHYSRPVPIPHEMPNTRYKVLFGMGRTNDE